MHQTVKSCEVLIVDETDLGICIQCYGYRATGTTATCYTHYVSSITSKIGGLAYYFMNFMNSKNESLGGV